VAEANRFGVAALFAVDADAQAGAGVVAPVRYRGPVLGSDPFYVGSASFPEGISRIFTACLIARPRLSVPPPFRTGTKSDRYSRLAGQAPRRPKIGSYY